MIVIPVRFVKCSMDLERKVSALKDFASFGTSPSKNGLSSPRSNPHSQNSFASSQNGWGNWFVKGEKDPILPSLAGFVAPFLLLKARKFVLLYTMGSLLTIGSFSLLWGPVNHVKHLCSFGRLPFTAAYFGSMFATLYMAIIVKSTVLTAVCAVLQIIALIWYFVSYIPGGSTGMKFFTKLFSSAVSKTVSSTLPV
ncbi:PREDICTED: protein transport protein SFT2-like isoform X1 [Acropora digitifera]|uniref:protein transport protein SFT2-like isoform X1 n=1 Tax=Acropora digitifera TaxID=70779 RepID=UPI00077B0466|nr:PREDICTED: protein transport protein SFT2-like isoform X1 [Acropora digitifera]